MYKKLAIIAIRYNNPSSWYFQDTVYANGMHYHIGMLTEYAESSLRAAICMVLRLHLERCVVWSAPIIAFSSTLSNMTSAQIANYNSEYQLIYCSTINNKKLQFVEDRSRATDRGDKVHMLDDIKLSNYANNSEHLFTTLQAMFNRWRMTN